MHGFGELRSILQQPPSVKSWESFCEWIGDYWNQDNANRSHIKEDWHDHIQKGLSKYLDNIRVAPDVWCTPPIKDLLIFARDNRALFLLDRLRVPEPTKTQWQPNLNVVIEHDLPIAQTTILEVHNAGILSLARADDVGLVISGDFDGYWTLWHEETLAVVCIGKISNKENIPIRLRIVSIDPQGTMFAAVGQISGGNYHQRELIIVDIESKKVIKRDEWANYKDLIWSKDGKFLISCDDYYV